ncbi:Transcriptional regulator, AraC family [Azospirillum doebereinerae]
MIAARFVEEALGCLHRRAIATEPVLLSAGLPPQVSEPVSAERYGELWRSIAATIDDEFFGLGGRPMRVGSFALLCHCVLHAETLEQALRRALRFLRVTLDDPCGELLIAHGLAQVLLKDAGDARPAFAYRTYWIILHGLICWLVGRRIPLRLVDFRCPEPDQSTEYSVFFGAPVRFEKPVSRLAFDAAYLKLPPVRNEQGLRQFLRSAPANILVRYRYDAGLAANMRKRLRQQSPLAWPSFDELAEQMRIPSSTLRHRLQQEGQSFRSIKDEIRRDLAVEWLQSTDRPVGEIAIELGYTEPSAFHRAFRKWTSQSPGVFRRDRKAVREPAGSARTGSGA